MLYKQTMMVLDTIFTNPGLTYKQLEKKIEAKYGNKNKAVLYLFLGDTHKDSHLRVIIRGMYCVEEKDGRYYVNLTLPLTDKNDINQIFIEGRLIELEKTRNT